MNEWNYLPDGDWGPMVPAGQGEKRRRAFERIGGAEGAAFTAGVLLALQHAPVDMANYYTGSTAPWGLFDRFGAPRENYKAFEYFSRLAGMSRRIEVSAGDGVYAAAAKSEAGDRVEVMIARSSDAEDVIRVRLLQLPWTGGTRCEIRRLQEGVSSFGRPNGIVRLDEKLRGPGTMLITLCPDK